MDLGFTRCGFEIALAIDRNAAAISTYRRNNPDVTVKQWDLSKVKPKEIVDLWERNTTEPVLGVIGGPPCQGFSQSNVHLKRDDERRTLPDRYAEILAAINERYRIHFFVFENVAGLLTKLHKSDFDRFVQQFEQAGFHVYQDILDAQMYGVPQRRRRLFIVGLNTELYPKQAFEFPEGRLSAFPSTVRTAIGTLPDPVFYSRGLVENDIPHHPNHWAMNPKSKRFQEPERLRREAGKPGGRSFRVLAWDAPSWTVAYGNREVHVHPEGRRRISVYEAMLLQSFPPEYVLEGTMSAQFRQISDAVPPPVAEAIGAAICEHLVIDSRASAPQDLHCLDRQAGT